jgi:hypothetical protein
MIKPGAGDGVTSASWMLTTRASASDALTRVVAATPTVVVSGPPQVATTGWPVGQGLGGVAVVRGIGAAAAKSAPFWSVSVQPPAPRVAAVVLLGAGVGPAPSKKLALP